jgi:hypothetical protein
MPAMFVLQLARPMARIRGAPPRIFSPVIVNDWLPTRA